jgi:Ribbon-helix-helix protein, copG family
MNKGRSEQESRRTKERVQLDFSPQALERLDELKERTGAATRAETIRQALRLYDWFVRETTDPNTRVIIQSADGEILAKFMAILLHDEMGTGATISGYLNRTQDRDTWSRKTERDRDEEKLSNSHP